ncbi:MAG: Gfo/Idh/MocA family oxidoreductase, partial [Firmicutes bacterium]|nr:Gfo/Idh/MocA family oxidoreductase [Bacillota bacterium]
DQALRRELEEQLGIPGFDSLHQLLGHVAVEAVALAPVNSEKAQLAVECMEAGLHVIVDKPLAVSWEQLESLHSAYERTERILSLMLPLRFTPCYATARRLVHEGAIGRLVHAWLTRPHKLLRPTRPDWMFRRATYGGLIPDLTIHDIDYFRWVVGATLEDVEQLFALHGNYGASGESDFEDAAHVLLRLKDGTVGSFEANWYTPSAAPYHGDCRAIFTGERGTIEVDTVRDRVILTTDEAPPTEVPLDETPSVEDDFVTGIRSGVDHMVLPPEDALESVAWTLRARDVADGCGVARR